jgi:hypothetical protein
LGWNDWEYEETPAAPEGDITWIQVYCNHEWKAICLIISTVYNCKRCSIKKEDFEAWQNKKR